MTQFSTGYCVACDVQVTGERESSDNGLGPDGRLYCGECMKAMRLFQEQRHPGTVTFGPVVGLAGTGRGPSAPAEASATTRGGGGMAAKPGRAPEGTRATTGAKDEGRAPGAATTPAGAASAPAGPAAVRSAKPAPRTRPTPAVRPSLPLWPLAIAGLAAVVGLGFWALRGRERPAATANVPSTAHEPPVAEPPVTSPRNAPPTNAPAPEDPDVDLARDLPKKSDTPEDPPIVALEKTWAAAQRMLDRSRMREAVQAILAFDAAGDAALEARRTGLLDTARRALYGAERPWVDAQVAALERREGPAAARAYLADWLQAARPLYAADQVAQVEAALAALDAPATAEGDPTPADPPQTDPVPEKKPTPEPKPDPDPPDPAPETKQDPDPPDPTPEKKDPETPPSGDVLAADDTEALLAAEGKEVEVEGKVLRAAAAASGKIFWISFGKDKTSFQAVIFAKRLEAFTKEFGDLGKVLPESLVRVRGRVALYQGRPQIVLEDVAQLTVK